MDTLVKILLLPFALLGSLWAHYFAPPVVVVEGDAPPVVIGETPVDGDNATTTFTLAIGQSGAAHRLTLTPLSVEDSRCPRDVQCIWAGTVKARLAVDGPEGATESTLEIGKPATVQGRTVALVAVAPEPAAGQSVPQADYRLTVTVSPAAE